MNNKDVRITSIGQLQEAYGTNIDAIAITLSLAISRHLHLRELLDKSDSEGYKRANGLLASAIETFPYTSLKTNSRGWASQIRITRSDKTYTLALSKRCWEMVTRYALEQFGNNRNEQSTVDEQVTPAQTGFPDPDNEEYDDEVIVDEETLSDERFSGICRTVGELKDALFGAGRDWHVRELRRSGNECGRFYVSGEAQWNTNAVCYFNDGVAPGENRALMTVADLLNELDRFENNIEVYCYTASGAFNRLTRPWWGRDPLGGVKDDGTTRVFFQLVDEE